MEDERYRTRPLSVSERQEGRGATAKPCGSEYTTSPLQGILSQTGSLHSKTPHTHTPPQKKPTLKDLRRLSSVVSRTPETTRIPRGRLLCYPFFQVMSFENTHTHTNRRKSLFFNTICLRFAVVSRALKRHWAMSDKGRDWGVRRKTRLQTGGPL